MNPPRLDRRIPELDGIRGPAILLVLLWHFIPCQGSERAGGLLAAAGKMLSLTWSGVDLFFVLSGYLITGILIENRDAPNYFKAFYARRAFRILPLYLAVLGLFVLLTPTLGSDERYAWLFANPHPLNTYLTFTQNFPMGLQDAFGPNWLGVTWSLAVEEQFYLVAPAAVFLLPRRWLSIVAVLAIFSSVFMRHYLPGLLAFTMLPARADAFAAGVIAAIAMRNATIRSLLEQNKLFLLALFVGLLSGLMILTVQANYFGALRHTWIALTYAVFLLTAVLGCFGPLLRFSPLIWLGTVSYGVYLFHQPITGLLYWWPASNRHAARSDSDNLGADADTRRIGGLVLRLRTAACSLRSSLPVSS